MFTAEAKNKGLGEPDGAEKRMLDDVFSLAYEELLRLASFMRRKGPDKSLNSTALVHEAWLKLKNNHRLAAVSDQHLKAIAAGAMRQILVDQARLRNARKRGGDGAAVFVSIAESTERVPSTDREVLALDAALEELKETAPRQAAIVEARFFGGLSVAETAAALGVSESVVERDFRFARAWLKGRIRNQG